MVPFGNCLCQLYIYGALGDGLLLLYPHEEFQAGIELDAASQLLNEGAIDESAANGTGARDLQDVLFYWILMGLPFGNLQHTIIKILYMFAYGYVHVMII